MSSSVPKALVNKSFIKITSILVPSVQELAKEPLTKVPDRYVLLPDQETGLLSNNTSFPQVPVIDLAQLLSQDNKSQET
jgi:hypothetical protein